jgi:3-octaprenyl-4-hydroxybenzoate carboxy-lyase
MSVIRAFATPPANSNTAWRTAAPRRCEGSRRLCRRIAGPRSRCRPEGTPTAGAGSQPFRLNAADGGFFLDNGAVVSRDPDDPDNFGKQNIGCYRMQVKGPRKINVFTVPVHDAAIHLGKAELPAHLVPERCISASSTDCRTDTEPPCGPHWRQPVSASERPSQN